MSNSPQSQSGWQYLNNIQANRKVRIGAVSAAAVAAMFGQNIADGVLEVYGKFQGSQAAHYCEERLTSVTEGTVTYSGKNPLPEGQSGAVLFGYENALFVDVVPSPETKVSVCTSTGASQPCMKDQSNAVTIMSGVNLNVADSVISLVDSGSVISGERIVLAPRDYETTSRKFLNFTFDTGSGQTASGLAPAFARFKITPCNLLGVGC